jgi:hypothetical protein
VDPTAPTTFWAANEYATAAASNNWGTWVTNFFLPSNPAVINYGSSSQYENVFRVGMDDNLYVDHWDPNTGWKWINQGNPGVGFASSPAVINYGSSSQYENVFLTGTNGNLYVDHWDPNTGWKWINQGAGGFPGNIPQGSPSSATPLPPGAQLESSALPISSPSGKAVRVRLSNAADMHRSSLARSRALAISDLLLGDLSHRRQPRELLD